jgi:AraC-like DNA-binding protein
VGLAAIDILPWYFSSAMHWDTITREIVANHHIFYTQKAGFIPTAYGNFIRPVLYLIYILFTWRFLHAHAILRKESRRTVGNRWLIFLVTVLSISQVLISLVALLRIVNQVTVTLGSANFLIFILIHNVLLISIILFIIYQPRILYSYVFVSEMKFTKKVNDTDILHPAPIQASALAEVESAPVPAKKSLLLSAREAAYKEAILQYMETQKPYLKPDFQISQLSQNLNIPAHHCSYVLNYLIGKNFRDWINSYRVNHFIQQYELKSEMMTIEALASEAGFSNSATFYNAFKKEYIILPTDYFRQKKQRENVQ